LENEVAPGNFKARPEYGRLLASLTYREMLRGVCRHQMSKRLGVL